MRALPRFAAVGRKAAAAIVFLGACAPAAPRMPAPANPLAVIDSVLATPPLDRTLWGISVLDQASGEVVYERNSNRHFIPASNTKLVVAAVALGTLGPDWRYDTPVLLGLPRDTIPDLLITGRGDPTWSRRFYPDATAPLDSIAAMVARAGFHRIRDVVIDATWFRDALVHPTWEISDLPWSYAPPIDAFAIEEGAFRVIVSPGARPGEPARITTALPGTQPLRSSIITDSMGAPTRISVDYMERSDTIVMRGTIAALAAPDTSNLAVISPAHSAALALQGRLQERGITVAGAVRVLRDTAAAAEYVARMDTAFQVIGHMRSAPLDSVVAAILRPSQNWIAEQLLKTVAAELTDEGSWPSGVAYERRFLIDRAGIDSTAFHLRDASGLSVQNLLTPAATVALLEFVRRQPWGGVYRDALPSPGMKESTLENRLPEIGDRLRAKTGTITHVNSLAGYLQTADGRVLTFSIMTNASGVSSAMVRRGIDTIVQALAAPGRVL
jgi:D-alanyl-D-alanine carboxypeptidase/D-alanyl-D-alanine-endopeptidase (penicillin-binding protein 4)